MPPARTLKLAIVLVVALGVTAAFANSAGPSPGYTGAPGEFTCRQCHTSFPLNDGGGSVEIVDAPATYSPGETYTITVRVRHADRRRWGFQLVALGEALEQAGTFALVDAGRTQLKTDGGKTYVEHRTAGTFAGTTGGASWSVRWTAPAVEAGVVSFYAAGNAANDNGLETGDNIYTAFFDSSPEVAAVPFEDETAAAGLAGAGGGSGVAWADVDLDGDQDFYVARDGRDLLFRNDGGVFSETAAALGLTADEPSRSAAWGDFDNDGRPDLFVATAAGPRLWRNGPGGFADATPALPPTGPAAVGAWVDYDADGWLDLFAAAEPGALLLRNDRAGGFADVTAGAGLEQIAGARAAAWADYDADGRADLFVALASGGRLYRQLEGGAFEESTAAAGISPPAGGRDAAWADYDGDGLLDLFVAGEAAVRLFRNRGDATFADQTAAAGLGPGGALALAAGDSDGDGRLDLAAAGGSGLRLLRYRSPAYADETGPAGIVAAEASVAVWADYDGDGREDLLALSPSETTLWRNPSAAAGVTVRAVTDADGDASDAESSSDRDAIGGVVTLDAAGPLQTRLVSGGGSAAQPPARAVFARPAGAAVARAAFPGGEERQAEVAAGATALSLADPRAARVEAASVKAKNGTSRLLVDGSGFATGREVVEAGGRAMAKTKYPKKRRLADGTSTRLSATDPSFDALVPPGRPVRVTTYDPQTGARSAPLFWLRPD